MTFNQLVVHTSGASPIFTASSGTFEFLMNRAFAFPSAGAPLFGFSGTVTAVLQFIASGGGDGTNPLVVATGGTANVGVRGFDITQFNPNAFGASSGATLSIALDASSSAAAPIGAGWTVGFTDVASGVGITVNPTDWVATVPQNTQDAINRMAALVVTLNGGNPIP